MKHRNLLTRLILGIGLLVCTCATNVSAEVTHPTDPETMERAAFDAATQVAGKTVNVIRGLGSGQGIHKVTIIPVKFDDRNIGGLDEDSKNIYDKTMKTFEGELTRLFQEQKINGIHGTIVLNEKDYEWFKNNVTDFTDDLFAPESADDEGVKKLKEMLLKYPGTLFVRVTIDSCKMNADTISATATISTTTFNDEGEKHESIATAKAESNKKNTILAYIMQNLDNPIFWIIVGVLTVVLFIFLIAAMPLGRKLILAGQPRKLKR